MHINVTVIISYTRYYVLLYYTILSYRSIVYVVKYVKISKKGRASCFEHVNELVLDIVVKKTEQTGRALQVVSSFYVINNKIEPLSSGAPTRNSLSLKYLLLARYVRVLSPVFLDQRTSASPFTLTWRLWAETSFSSIRVTLPLTVSPSEKVPLSFSASYVSAKLCTEGIVLGGPRGQKGV